LAKLGTGLLPPLRGPPPSEMEALDTTDSDMINTK